MFGFLAQLLAWCFDLVPNYAIAITIFTLIVMIAVTPFTIKGMRSQAEMSRLQPEMKKLQDQYKNDRIKQNEEMQALFKEHGVNPLGGCLPMLLPLPIFFIIFRLLRSLASRHNGVFAPLVRVLRRQAGAISSGYATPHYLSYKSAMTQHLIRDNGVMKSFGMNLAATARQHHPSPAAAVPFYLLIVIMTAAQYWQQRQISNRMPAGSQNQQTKLMMQLFPAFYAVISINIPASVVFYLLVSSVFRMIQTTLSYRYDPVMAPPAQPPAEITVGSRPKAPAGNGRNGAASGARAAAVVAEPKKGFFASLRETAEQTRREQPAKGSGGRATAARSTSGRPNSGRTTGRVTPSPNQSRDKGRTTDRPGRSSGSAPSSTPSPPAKSAPSRDQPAPSQGEPTPAGSSAVMEAPVEEPVIVEASVVEPADEPVVAEAPVAPAVASAPAVEERPPGYREPSGAPPDDVRPDSGPSPLSVRPSGRFTPPSGGKKRRG